MKVEIEANLFIEADSMQFMVKSYKSQNDKKGKALAYYSTLASCLKFIVSLKIKQSTAQTLAELVQDIERIEQYIHTKISV